MGWLKQLAALELAHLSRIERMIERMADELKHLQDQVTALQTSATRSGTGVDKLIQLVTDLRGSNIDPALVEAASVAIQAVITAMDAKSTQAEAV